VSKTPASWRSERKRVGARAGVTRTPHRPAE
jgi:hypothetical protein